MKKEDADLLVAALRSGKYKQGTGCLRNSKDEFCCLGVYATEKGVKPFFHSHLKTWFFGGISGGISGYLNLGISRFGQFSEEADLSMISNRSDIKFSNLSSLNDSGVPFNEIADFVEKNWVYIN